ncbi:ACT domain-containing protein, partial [Streptomyces montanisoli]
CSSDPWRRQRRLAAEALRTGGPVLTLSTDHAPGDADPSGSGGAAVTDGEPAPEPVGVELHIAVPERPGVLPAAAGVLALHRLAVRSADLRAVELPSGTGGPGPTANVLLLSWRVAAQFGPLPAPARLRADLVRALDGTLDIAARLAERDAAYPRRRGAGAPPPRVSVAGDASREATVIEVRARDAPGLLYRVGHALEAADVRVRSAHVSTLGADAVDTVYVTRPDGAPLTAEEAETTAKRVAEALPA